MSIPWVHLGPVNSGGQSQMPFPKHLPLFSQGLGLQSSRLHSPIFRLDWSRVSSKSSISPLMTTSLKHPLNPVRLDISGGMVLLPGGICPRNSGPLRSSELFLCKVECVSVCGFGMQ